MPEAVDQSPGRDPDEVMESLRIADFYVISRVGARGQATARDLIKWPTFHGWRVRRSLRRLRQRGIAERDGRNYRLTEFGRKLAPVALSALTFHLYDDGLQAMIEDDKRGASTRWGRPWEP